LATVAELSPDYSPFFQLTPLTAVVQVIILVIDVGVDGGVLRVESSADAGVVLWLGLEEVRVVGACHQPPAGGDGLLLQE
jgi:hypothetical protein